MVVLDDRVVELSKSTAKILVVGPAIATFVPAEHQQKVFDKVLPLKKGGPFHIQYTGLSIVSEIVGGMAAIGVGAAVIDNGPMMVTGIVTGVAACLDAVLIRPYGFFTGSLDARPWAILPVEFGYALMKAGRGLYHNLAKPKTQ